MYEFHKPRRLIHKRIKSIAPHATRKAKRIFRFKYPKLFLLVCLIVLAYYIFSSNSINSLIFGLNELSYIGIFISGILVSFGFSAPFAVGFFITTHPQSIFLASIIGGLGASLGDLLIFKTIKFSFMNELNKLKKEKISKEIRIIARKNIDVKIRHYFLYLFAGILIATPLPDEVGVSMLAGLTTIKVKFLWIISLTLHTAAIFLIFVASSS